MSRWLCSFPAGPQNATYVDPHLAIYSNNQVVTGEKVPYEHV